MIFEKGKGRSVEDAETGPVNVEDMADGNIYRSTIQSETSRLTQADKIEALLRSRYGQWVPAYELSDLALQYCARVNSIRKKLARGGDREGIENRTQRVGGQVRGSYRIVRTLDAFGIAPAKPQPPKSWDEIVREREQKLRQPEQEFELQP